MFKNVSLYIQTGFDVELQDLIDTGTWSNQRLTDVITFSEAESCWCSVAKMKESFLLKITCFDNVHFQNSLMLPIRNNYIEGVYVIANRLFAATKISFISLGMLGIFNNQRELVDNGEHTVEHIHIQYKLYGQDDREMMRLYQVHI